MFARPKIEEFNRGLFIISIHMMTDLRFALGQLCKSPGYTFLAVITLRLGIGLFTAIFSLINDLFLRGLPFSEPDPNPILTLRAD